MTDDADRRPGAREGRPGSGLKRWFFLYALALAVTVLGLLLLVTPAPGAQTLRLPGTDFTMDLGSQRLRGAGLLVLGCAAMAWSMLRLVGAFLEGLLPSQQTQIAGALYSRRVLGRGPRVVAIGGGTGMSTLLRGLKRYTSNLTAVITVCDDGGSSGRLRRELSMLPPGDFRQCLAALAEADPLVTRLFEHRFETSGELGGHAFGNLFIAAMAQITGSFERALEESSRVLAVRGRILPSTLADIRLGAEMTDGSLVAGESNIPLAGASDPAGPGRRIRRVFLEPAAPPAHAEAARAVREADLVVLGPGSLFTSLVPNLLVAELATAIRESPGVRVYVCNVAEQPGETDGFSVLDHVRAIQEHCGGSLPFSHVVVAAAPKGELALSADVAGMERLGVRVVEADVVDRQRPTRHDPGRLAKVLLRIYVRA